MVVGRLGIALRLPHMGEGGEAAVVRLIRPSGQCSRLFALRLGPPRFSGFHALCCVLHAKAGEDHKRLVGMLIPDRALPELLAELQRPADLAAAATGTAGGWPSGGSTRGGSGVGTLPAHGPQKRSLMDIISIMT